MLSVHPLVFVTVSMIVFEPGVWYTYDGFWLLDVPEVSPKFQTQPVTLPYFVVLESTNKVAAGRH